MGQFLMPSASTGNIPGGFRSLQGMLYTMQSVENVLVFGQILWFHVVFFLENFRNLGEVKVRSLGEGRV